MYGVGEVVDERGNTVWPPMRGVEAIMPIFVQRM